MGKKYMPRDVFEVGVATIGRMHLLSNRPPREIAEMAWHTYATSIIDDGVVDDLVLATEQSVDWLRKQNAPAPAEFFHHFQWYVLSHDDKGAPKRRKWLDGLLFSRSVKDPDRVANLQNKLVVYYVGLTSGALPPAPIGWKFGG